MSMDKNKKPKPGATRVSPLNTHLRDMQREAAKRAQADKVWKTLQRESANNDGRNTI
jgi:hypothetical protein